MYSRGWRRTGAKPPEKPSTRIPRLWRISPQYHELSVYTNNAESFYNGLLVSVRRHKGGIQLDANYVLSKSIDDGSGLESEGSLYNGVLPDSFTPRSERGFSDFDLRHNFNANLVYELPVGRGKAL